jgi:tetratricopeptide (TPR) repeat protein
MARWSGEMEFEFIEGSDSFVATDKIVGFLRQHLARGEVAAAARLYEDAGSACAAELLQEARVSSSNTQKALAEMFIVARDFRSAAAVFEMARQLERAGELFAQALAFDDAARVHEKNGDLLRAAACHERAGRLDRAIELYRQAGPSQALAEALARQGHYYDAAAVFKYIFNLKAEIEMLRLVPSTSANRVPAVLRLAELLEQYHHSDQAVGLLIETIRTVDAARFHQSMYGQLARLLDAMGRATEAAQVRARMQNLLAGTATETASGAGSTTVAAALPSPATAAPSVPAPAPTVGSWGSRAPSAVSSPAPSAVSSPGLTGGVGRPAVPVRTVASVAGAGAEAVSVGPAGVPSRDPFAALVDPFTQRQGLPAAADAYTHLKAIPIFAELRAEDMRDLYRAAEEVTFADGDVLIGEGTAGRGLFVVVEGEVSVTRADSPGELARLGPGSCVGELSLLDASLTAARVTASGPVFALFISKARFDVFIAHHDDAARRVFHLFARTLAERLRAANARA